MNVPSWVAWLVLGLSLFVAGAWAYHDLRMELLAKLRPLDLSVEVSRLRVLDPTPGAGASGQLLVIDAARITNRSAEDQVSLGINFVAEVGENVTLIVREDEGRKWKQFPSATPLTTPLAIKPQSTEDGPLAFWVSDVFAGTLGPNVDRVKARIEIEDYVSDGSVTVPVPGSHP